MADASDSAAAGGAKRAQSGQPLRTTINSGPVSLAGRSLPSWCAPSRPGTGTCVFARCWRGGAWTATARPADLSAPAWSRAQTTHVHLLGFAVLYGATGGLFSVAGTAKKVGVIDPYLARERSTGRVLE